MLTLKLEIGLGKLRIETGEIANMMLIVG